MLGCLALLGSLFMPWFERVSITQFDGTIVEGFTGWASFRYADLALVAAVAAAGGLIAAAWTLPDRWPGAALGFIGVVVAVSVLYAVFRPTFGAGQAYRPGLGFPAALLAAGLIAGGGWWTALARNVP